MNWRKHTINWNKLKDEDTLNNKINLKQKECQSRPAMEML